MSAQAMMWAWHLTGCSPAAKLLAVWISDGCGSEDGVSRFEIVRACSFVGIDERAFWAALRELTASGFRAGPDEGGFVTCRIPLPPRPKSSPPRRAHQRAEIYVITAGGKTKIGISSDIEARLAWIQSGNPNPISVALRLPGVLHKVHAVERESHRRLNEHRVAGEWFDVDAERAVALVRAVAAELGLE